MDAPVEHLRFQKIAPGQDFHAALALDFGRRAECVLHTHDFSEVFYVLEGTGTHAINGAERLLHTGDLLWIRPQDRHSFYLRPGQKLHFINIAFPQSVWTDFRQLALNTPEPALWERDPDPCVQAVPSARRGDCERLFQDMLHRYYAGPTRLALCHFWSEILPLILPSASAEDTASTRESGPAWLAHACLALRSDAALRDGVPRLVELAGVSPAHLARTLKASQGQTPTEYVNTLRLEQAAILLATTAEEIIEIAEDCGFPNLSYFYRLFRRRFGASPRRYRLAARHAIVP